MLRLKLNHVSKRGYRYEMPVIIAALLIPINNYEGTELCMNVLSLHGENEYNDFA